MANDNSKKDMDLTADEDLLSILRDDPTVKAAIQAGAASQEPPDLTGLQNVVQEELTDMSTLGTGNRDLDLDSWFRGGSRVPSSPLSSFVDNAEIKLDYGINLNSLTHISLMGKVRKFLEDASEMTFDQSAIVGMDNKEMNDRIKLAMDIYKELFTLSQRTQQNIKNARIKGNESSSIDELKVLLSSIPEGKLKEILRMLVEQEDT